MRESWAILIKRTSSLRVFTRTTTKLSTKLKEIRLSGVSLRVDPAAQQIHSYHKNQWQRYGQE